MSRKIKRDASRRRKRARRSAGVSRSKPTNRNIRVALFLSVIFMISAVLTLTGVLSTVRQHGHVHLDLRLLLVDGVVGTFAAVEWLLWMKQN